MAMKERHPNAERLAGAISSRRAAQRWSYARVHRGGGPTKPTQMAYERADIPATITSEALEKVDTGLGWEPGTALGILGGGEAPDPGQPVASPPTTPDTPEESGPDDLLGQVLPAFQRFQELRRRLKELDLPDDVREQVNEITAIQNDILMDQVGPPHPKAVTSGQIHPVYR
jgi:hypothetical protein